MRSRRQHRARSASLSTSENKIWQKQRNISQRAANSKPRFSQLPRYRSCSEKRSRDNSGIQTWNMDISAYHGAWHNGAQHGTPSRIAHGISGGCGQRKSSNAHIEKKRKSSSAASKTSAPSRLRTLRAPASRVRCILRGWANRRAANGRDGRRWRYGHRTGRVTGSPWTGR